jgi:hypothetical protein
VVLSPPLHSPYKLTGLAFTVASEPSEPISPPRVREQGRPRRLQHDANVATNYQP